VSNPFIGNPIMRGVIALLASAAVSSAACAAGVDKVVSTVIHAGHVLTEPGKPVLERQTIVVENGKITAIKPGFIGDSRAIDLRDSWVMPGLIDMHTHITGVLDMQGPVAAQIAMAYMGRPAERVLNMLPTVKSLLLSGFTTIRVLGDPSSSVYDLRDAINKDIVPGPRIIGIEPQISLAGGDYDAANFRVRLDLEQYVHNRGTCSGVDDCIRVVREEVRRGADVIKLRQSALPFLDPKIAMVESAAEIKAIVDMAHQLNRKVAAHVVGTPAYLHMVIVAGADTIEHGPLDETAIDLMKQHDTAYTPTLLAAKVLDEAESTRYYEAAAAGLRKAYAAGVKIVFGTDLGMFGPERVHEEFPLLAAAGMPAEQVLRAATINAAEKLGRADSLGSIAIGKSADLIAFKSDPRAKLEQVGDPAKVAFVMKAGKVFKQ